MAIPRIDANMPITWSSEWEIGIPLIDSQHQRLVEMTENLRQTVLLERSNTSKITKVLKGLITYCADHFECEQMLMQMIGYGSYSAHLAKHKLFTAQTLQWFDDFQNGNLDPKVVMYTLVEWLVEHIFHTDITILQCCQKKGIDYTNFRTVSDVIPNERANSIWDIPIEFGVTSLLLPCLGLLSWIAFWPGPSSPIASAIVLAVHVVLYLVIIIYLRKNLQLRTEKLHLHNARQLADNLLAGEIAKRIAVMDLDDIDSVIANETSPLVMALQEIVESVRMYLPYIPDTILSVVRGETDESENDGVMDGVPSQIGRYAVPNEVNRHVSRSPSHASHTSKTRTTMAWSENGLPKAISKDSVYTAVTSETELPHSNSQERLSGSTKPSKSMKNMFQRNASSTSSGNYEVGPSTLKEQGKNSTGSFHTHSGTVRHSTISDSKLVSRHGTTTHHAPAISVTATAKALSTTWLTKKSISLLVADISGFHELSNSLSIDDLLALHSSYVTTVEAICKQSKGKLNDIIGDRLTLSWNAANSVGNYAQQACKAAIKIRESICKADETQKNVLQVKVAVGTGNALVGNMGSKSTLSFSIVGPVSIITFALCKLNGFVQTDILICSNTWRNAKEFFIAKVMFQFDIACSGSSEEDSILEEVAHAPEGENMTLEAVTPLVHGSPCHSPKSKWISQSAHHAELRKMYALQLVSAQGHQEGDEWMYVLQNAVNPYEAYNEAVFQLYYGSFAIGFAALKKFVETCPSADKWALELLHFCEYHHGKGGPTTELPLKWTYGWHQYST